MRFMPQLTNYSVRGAICLFSAALAAQSPLTTTFVSNNGGLTGGMIFFDLDVINPAGITIKQLDINTQSITGDLQVFTGPQNY